MASNRHGVPIKQWRKWCNVGQATFNRLWDELKWDCQAREVKLDKTFRWNACWLAAEVAEGIEKDRKAGCFSGDKR
ncbi:MAG: hypothetical protein WC822_01435 [Candidatus Paceibacterota bacterium]|jgi:hypothetical protein